MKKSNTKQMMKRVQAKIVPALERGAGALGAAFLHNKMEDYNLPIDKKYGGPLLILIGVAGEVIFDKNPHIVAVSQGVTTYGTMRTAIDLAMPNQAANFGLGQQSYSTEYDGNTSPLLDYTEIDGLGEFEVDEFEVDGLGEFEDEDERFMIPDQNVVPGLSPAVNPISNAIQRAPGAPQGIQGNDEDVAEEQYVEGLFS